MRWCFLFFIFFLKVFFVLFKRRKSMTFTQNKKKVQGKFCVVLFAFYWFNKMRGLQIWRQQLPTVNFNFNFNQPLYLLKLELYVQNVNNIKKILQNMYLQVRLNGDLVACQMILFVTHFFSRNLNSYSFIIFMRCVCDTCRYLCDFWVHTKCPTASEVFCLLILWQMSMYPTLCAFYIDLISFSFKLWPL